MAGNQPEKLLKSAYLKAAHGENQISSNDDRLQIKAVRAMCIMELLSYDISKDPSTITDDDLKQTNIWKKMIQGDNVHEVFDAINEFTKLKLDITRSTHARNVLTAIGVPIGLGAAGLVGSAVAVGSIFLPPLGFGVAVGISVGISAVSTAGGVGVAAKKLLNKEEIKKNMSKTVDQCDTYTEVLKKILKLCNEPEDTQPGQFLEKTLRDCFKQFGYFATDGRGWKNADYIIKVMKSQLGVIRTLDDKTLKTILNIAYFAIEFMLPLKETRSWLVSVVGPQDAGKTTLIKKTWDPPGKPMVGSITEHTEDVIAYEISSDEIIVVDTPGTNSVDEKLRKQLDNWGAAASCFIFVYNFQSDVDDDFIKAFVEIAKFDSPMLVCLNQSARRALSEEDELFDKAKREKILATYNQQISETKFRKPFEVHFTEMVLYSAKLGSIGVKSVEYVRDWVKKTIDNC